MCLGGPECPSAPVHVSTEEWVPRVPEAIRGRDRSSGTAWQRGGLNFGLREGSADVFNSNILRMTYERI